MKLNDFIYFSFIIAGCFHGCWWWWVCCFSARKHILNKPLVHVLCAECNGLTKPQVNKWVYCFFPQLARWDAHSSLFRLWSRNSKETASVRGCAKKYFKAFSIKFLRAIMLPTVDRTYMKVFRKLFIDHWQSLVCGMQFSVAQKLLNSNWLFTEIKRI